jgi:transcriptional regulator with XRE-family HTH domain
MVTDETDPSDPAFARQVGERLRNIRRQQGLSLQAVEETSGREFKASVLGAYERGERIISVLRLQRLAALYGVPVDQLLPRTSTPISQGRAADGRDGHVTLDLVRLERIDAPERDLLRRYIGMIQLQRGDFNGRVLTVRDEDVRSLGRIFERDETGMRERLDELGLWVRESVPASPPSEIRPA